MPSHRTYYWDSDVVIALLQKEAGRVDILHSITDEAEKGRVRIVVSAFSMCEVGRVEGTPLPEDQEEIIMEFFDSPYVHVHQVDRTVARKSREILRRFDSVPGKDAVHLATAVLAGVEAMHSYDSRHMLKVDGQIEGLAITEPAWEGGQAPLTGLDDASGQGAQPESVAGEAQAEAVEEEGQDTKGGDTATPDGEQSADPTSPDASEIEW